MSVVVHLRAVVLGVRGGVTIVGDHRLRGAGGGGPGVRGDPHSDVTDELLAPDVGQIRTLGGAVELLVAIQIPLILDDRPVGTVRASGIQQKRLTDGMRIRPLNPSEHRLPCLRIRRSIRRERLPCQLRNTNFFEQGFPDLFVPSQVGVIPFHFVKRQG